MKQLLITTLSVLLGAVSASAAIDRISVHSPSMHKEIDCTVIIPDNYGDTKEFPVLYLLHGYGGDPDTWLGIKPELPELATRYNMIIASPDGANSWYWDSPEDSTLLYETFVTSELVPAIDARYRTVADKSGRAISGFSMGGHGALWLGIRHQDTFGACGSTSGGVDIRPFPENWEIKKSLGEYSSHPENWDMHTIANQIHLLKPDYPIIIDCGTEDFFYNVNQALHDALLYRNIKHEYITRPGTHKATYWSISIEPQLLFFSNFFNGKPVYDTP